MAWPGIYPMGVQNWWGYGPRGTSRRNQAAGVTRTQAQNRRIDQLLGRLNALQGRSQQSQMPPMSQQEYTTLYHQQQMMNRNPHLARVAPGRMGRDPLEMARSPYGFQGYGYAAGAPERLAGPAARYAQPQLWGGIGYTPPAQLLPESWGTSRPGMYAREFEGLGAHIPSLESPEGRRERAMPPALARHMRAVGAENEAPTTRDVMRMRSRARMGRLYSDLYRRNLASGVAPRLAEAEAATRMYNRMGQGGLMGPAEMRLLYREQAPEAMAAAGAMAQPGADLRRAQLEYEVGMKQYSPEALAAGLIGAFLGTPEGAALYTEDPSVIDPLRSGGVPAPSAPQPDNWIDATAARLPAVARPGFIKRIREGDIEGAREYVRTFFPEEEEEELDQFMPPTKREAYDRRMRDEWRRLGLGILGRAGTPGMPGGAYGVPR